MLYKPFTHQRETIDFLHQTPRAFIASTMGTGKTYSIIADIEKRIQANPKEKVLVIAPKSLVHSVWQNDINKFAPHLTCTIALAPEKKRRASFEKRVNIYITNTDATTWMAKNLPPSYFKDFSTIILDESTSFKHLSARTKALHKLRKHFPIRRCLSGTPTAGPLTDLYYQYFFLDDGKMLGLRFNDYKYQVQYAIQTGPQPNMVKWVNKPGKEEVVAYILKDITIRHVLEDVVDMPARISYSMGFKPNATTLRAYKALKATARAQLKTGNINAVNAAALTTKLLQTLSGAVYDEEGKPHLVDPQRYELIMDLVDQTDHSVVFYNWTSQRLHLMELATKNKVNATFIDGTVNDKERHQRVNDYQAGKYKTIFLQVKAAAHGLTLTRATTTIWSCPTYLADYYIQANARIYRIGQKKRTTVINVEAEGTLEKRVYENLNGKLNSIELLNEALKEDIT